MIIKGIAKGDKDLRHFTFDDGDFVVRGGVYYYKVNYGKNQLEGEYAEDEIGYVECDKIIPLGGRRPKPIPGRKQQVKEDVSAVIKEADSDEKPKRGRPAKAAKIPNKNESAVILPPGDEQSGSNTFEYLVTEIKVDDIESLQNKLNTAGSEGWEMCGFDTNKSLFGTIHIVAIFKRKRG